MEIPHYLRPEIGEAIVPVLKASLSDPPGQDGSSSDEIEEDDDDE
jgi:hypothetical protein